MKLKKKHGIETLRSRYGLMFITPWLIGIVVFFALPLIQSVMYSFSKVSVSTQGMQMSFLGLDHYKYLINEDPDYTKMLTEALTSFTYKLPLIVILSLILALLLNQKFKGRIFFRCLFFLPVIIATGPVMNLIFRTTTDDLSTAASAVAGGVVSADSVMAFLSLPEDFAAVVTDIVNNIFDLIWNCGIQIILFISGLQTIQSSIYEASHVEGATKWEQFWFITFPMLGHVSLLVIVFTMVDLFTDSRIELIKNISTRMSAGKYDETSAMLWIYFVIIMAVMGILLLLYNKLLLKKWE